MLRELAPEIERSAPGRLQAKRLPALATLIRIGEGEARGFLRFDDVLGMGGDRHRAALADNLQFDDPINIQFTSGTTGAPKGATLTHHNILNNAYFAGERLGYTERDRVCVPVPFYHCFGMVLGNLGCTTRGACIVVPAESFDPRSVL